MVCGLVSASAMLTRRQRKTSHWGAKKTRERRDTPRGPGACSGAHCAKRTHNVLCPDVDLKLLAGDDGLVLHLIVLLHGDLRPRGYAQGKRCDGQLLVGMLTCGGEEEWEKIARLNTETAE